MPPVSLEEMIACVDRELAMRAKAYPRWVRAKPPKLTQRTADQEIARMQAVREALLRLEAQSLLLSQLVSADLTTRTNVDLSLDSLLVDVRSRFPVAAGG